MKSLTHLRVSAKLFVSFGIVLALTTALGVFAVVDLAQLARNTRTITGDLMPSLDRLNAINTDAAELRILQLRAVAASTPEDVSKYLQEAQVIINRMVGERADYRKVISNEQEQRIWDDYEAKWQQYLDLHARVVALMRQNQHADAEILLGESGQSLYDTAHAAIAAGIKQNTADAAEATADSASIYRNGLAVTIAMLGVAVLFGGVIAWLVSRAISRPLVQAVTVLQNIANGQLDNTVDVSRKDEIGTLFASLGQMQERLRSLIAENRGQVDAIGNVQAFIEFELDGTVLNANQNFLSTMGYSLEELRGRHHSTLVRPADRNSPDYERFWTKLRSGEFDKGRYVRIAKDGREVWLDAFYSPLLDANGKLYKVIKYASDVTSQVLQTQQMEEAVTQIQRAIKTATEGDLSVRVSSHDKRGELQKMAESINELLSSMSEIVSRVKEVAGDVHRSADEISQGNANLSQRTEEQSSSLEETASSMEEMTSTVKQNADNAGQANQLASAARDQADKGGAVTAKAVRAMSDINESSKKISDIIGVIDEIAFQTNLLALNAAVEAARAGEQGRGFAVVASEVRSLAGRSATAAKEIKDLIQDSVKKVADGSLLVTQSGQTLDQIVMSVKKVSDIVAEIAAASKEQSAGIDQVNKAVMQMDEMTQQNAALVEQATAASQSMAERARELNEMMMKYQLSDAPPVAIVKAVVNANASATVAFPAKERRAVNRPWIGKAQRSAAPIVKSVAEPAAPRMVAGAGNDAEWEEF